MAGEVIWVGVTLAAAACQTARNAMQGRLTERIGTVGATQVRFLYGFPFAILFLLGVLIVSGEPLPRPDAAFLLYACGGATAQIAATALMLAAMRQRSFSVTIALTKTEPVQVAVFGIAMLGDAVRPLAIVAIIIATVGVVLTSRMPKGAMEGRRSLKPALLGVVSGTCFALAAVGFRGAILSLGEGGYLLRAAFALVASLAIQSAMLGAYLALFDRAAFTGSLAAWRQSLFAGFMGAAASQLWFTGFALTSAANVRTLGLVEVLFAQMVSVRIFAQRASRREVAGMVLIVLGVALLLGAQ